MDSGMDSGTYGVDLRLGSQVAGPDEFLVWSAPLRESVPAETPPGTGILELAPDPRSVAAARRALRCPIAVTVPVHAPAAPAASAASAASAPGTESDRAEAAARLAADCVRAGADVLVGDHLAAVAASLGAALLCTDPRIARDAGVRPDGVIVDAGTAPAAAVSRLVESGSPVLVRPARGTPDADRSGEDDPAMLAAASVLAWLGVRIFRAGSPSDAAALRQVLDMVASIKGTRPPALARRGLA